MFTTRRQFLQTAAAASAGLALGHSQVSAIEPIKRNGKPHIRLSLAAYSYRIRVEDEMLIDSFGPAYAEYRHQVGALFPFRRSAPPVTNLDQTPSPSLEK